MTRYTSSVGGETSISWGVRGEGVISLASLSGGFDVIGPCQMIYAYLLSR
jgi:hypothetical protein